MISTATLRFVLYDHFNLLKQSFSIKLRSGIKINAKAKPRINGINVVKKEPKNLNITAPFFKIKYVIKNPFDIFGIGKVAVEQNLKTDAWLGENKDTFTSKGKSNEQEVYITSKGSVYHTKLTCTHLLRNIQSISASQIKDIRNSSGGIYYECEYCNDYDGSSVVYYTQYGSRYHKNSGCVQLQRTIIRVPLSEVKDRKLCEKCGSGE